MKRVERAGRAPAESARKEIEVKLRIADRSALRRRLTGLRAKLQGTRTHEMNTLYDTSEGTLFRSGRMLRVRVQQPASETGKAKKRGQRSARRPMVWLTYKGPAQADDASGMRRGPSYKIREEREVCVVEGEGVAGILAGIGLSPRFRYEKYRSCYRLPGLPGLKVELDETPIGDFLELEGECEAIDRSARLLGFGPADYITQGYGSLYLERMATRSSEKSRRKPADVERPRDMLF